MPPDRDRFAFAPGLPLKRSFGAFLVDRIDVKCAQRLPVLRVEFRLVPIMIIFPGLQILALFLRQDAEEAGALTAGIGLRTSAHSSCSSDSRHRQSGIDTIGPRAR